MTGDDLDQEVADYLNGQSRRTAIAWIAAVVGVLAAIGLGYAVYAVNTGNDNADRATAAELREARADTKETRSELSKVAANYDKLYAQFEACKDEKPKTTGCKEPVVPPVDEVTPSSPSASSGPVVIERLTDAEIDQAVRRFCSDTGQCEGRDASKSMVSAAVTAYCDAHGQCTPPAPADGKDGQDGAAGADAPPPSDAQVQASVAAWCAEHGCKGDPGPLCPEGFHGEIVTVVTSFAPPQEEEIYACRRDTAEQ